MVLYTLRIVAAIALALVAMAPSFAASTAKEAIKDATAAAQKWQPDAVLTHVATIMGHGDGKADQWLYTFYSPKAKKSAIVTAHDNKLEVDADVRNSSTAALGGEFLDSDKATEAAAKAGLKFAKADKGLALGLVVGSQSLLWAVTVTSKSGFSGVTLNARDGAFIKRDDINLK